MMTCLGKIRAASSFRHLGTGYYSLSTHAEATPASWQTRPWIQSFQFTFPTLQSSIRWTKTIEMNEEKQRVPDQIVGKHYIHSSYPRSHNACMCICWRMLQCVLTSIFHKLIWLWTFTFMQNIYPQLRTVPGI